jgi:predicted DNA-binding ribbon-helix-helix protein
MTGHNLLPKMPYTLPLSSALCCVRGEGEAMKSTVAKRSIVVAGHKTSVSLEDAFWKGLREIADGRDMTLSDLVGTIDGNRQYGNLSSAIRLFVLGQYRDRLVVYRDQVADHQGRPAQEQLVA